MSTIPTTSLGDNVVYVSGKGHAKHAIVVGTPETVIPGTELPELSEGQLYIVVWEFGVGHFVPKGQVPHFSQIDGNSEFTNDDGVPVNYWKLATE